MNTQEIVRKWIELYREIMSVYNKMVAQNSTYTRLDIGNEVTDTDTTPHGFSSADFVTSVANTQTILSAMESNLTNIDRIANSQD